MHGPVNPGIGALYLEDFQVGNRYRSSAITVTEDRIIAFALDYDPLPFHIDVEAGRDHPHGGIFASGLHTLSLSFRLLHISGVLAACAYSGAGMDNVRWLRRVSPGDSLHLEIEVLTVRPSRSRPELGTLVLRQDTVNQDGDMVLTLECTHIVRKRPDRP